MNEKNKNGVFDNVFKDFPNLASLPGSDVNNLQMSDTPDTTSAQDNNQLNGFLKIDIEKDAESINPLNRPFKIDLEADAVTIIEADTAPINPFDVDIPDDIITLASKLDSKNPRMYRATDTSVPGGMFRSLGINISIRGVVTNCQIEAYQMCLEYPNDLQLQSDFEIKNISKSATVTDGNTYIDLRTDLIGTPYDTKMNKYYWVVYLSYLKDNKKEYMKCYVQGECANGSRISVNGFITLICKGQLNAEIQYFKLCEQKAEIVNIISNYMGARNFQEMQEFLKTRNIMLHTSTAGANIKEALQVIGQIDNE